MEEPAGGLETLLPESDDEMQEEAPRQEEQDAHPADPAAASPENSQDSADHEQEQQDDVQQPPAAEEAHAAAQPQDSPAQHDMQAQDTRHADNAAMPEDHGTPAGEDQQARGNSSQPQEHGADAQQQEPEQTASQHDQQDEEDPQQQEQQPQEKQQQPDKQQEQRQQEPSSPQRSGKQQQQDKQQEQQEQQQQGSRRSTRQPIPAPPPPLAPAASPTGKKPDRPTSAKEDSSGKQQHSRVPFVLPRRESGDASRSGGSSRPAEAGSGGRDARLGSGRAAGRRPLSPDRDRDRERDRDRDRDRERDRQREREGDRERERERDRERDRERQRERDRERERRGAKAPSSSTRDNRQRQQPGEREHPAAAGRDARHSHSSGKERGHGSGGDREADRDRERERERERERGREQERDRARDTDRGRRGSPASRQGAAASGKGKAPAPSSAKAASPAKAATAAAAATAATAVAAAAGPGAFAAVDRFLAKQAMVEEVLLPTPTNVNTIHVPGDELLSFIRVQQWVQAECKTALPLVSGAFVLVSSADVLDPPCSRELMDACGYGANSGAFCRAVADCVPWRLRQIESVEVGPPGQQEPGEAKVLLQGGGCVKASSVSPDTLVDAQDYVYLCCELSELQEARGSSSTSSSSRRAVLKGLRVYDIAHVAWRMRVATELEASINKFYQDQAKMREEGGYDDEMLDLAKQGTLAGIAATIRQLPPFDWVDGQIMKYVELNPFARPEFPAEAREPLNADQRTSLTRFAVEAWCSFLKHRLEGRGPPPITEYVPWKVLPVAEEEQDTAMAAAGEPQTAGEPPTAAAAAAAAGEQQYDGAGGYQQQQQQQYGAPLPQPGVPLAYMQQQQQQLPAAAAMGNGGLGELGSLQLPPPQQQQQPAATIQQQRGTASLLDIDDDFGDDFGFYDDPLAPFDADPLLPGNSGARVGGLSGGALGSTTPGSGGALAKGMLGAGMSLDPSPTGAGLLGAAGGSGGSGGLADVHGSDNFAAAAAAAGAGAGGGGGGGSGGRDYNFWVQRGNQQAAAADPLRTRVGRDRDLTGGLLPETRAQGAGLTGTLGPMWGGQKPPPGMADGNLSSRQQQQQQQRDGRGSVLDRIGSPRADGGQGRGDAADRSREPAAAAAAAGGSGGGRSGGGRHGPSAFSMDARPGARARGGSSGGGGGSHSPGLGLRSHGRQRSSRSRSRSPGGRGSGRARSRTPVAARLGNRAGGRSPGRGQDRSPLGRSVDRARGCSPPEPKGRAPVTSRLGDRRSPVRERSKDRGRRHSPSADAKGRGAADSRRPAGRSLSPSKGGRDSCSQRERRDSPSGSKRKRDVGSPDDAKRRRRDGDSNAADDRRPSKASRANADADRPSSGRAAVPAAAAAGGGVGGSSPVRDIKAVARRFGGRLEGADSIFADIQVEKDLKAWLRDLAAYVGEPPRPSEQPKVLLLKDLARELPLPRHVVNAYNGVTKLIHARPELNFVAIGRVQLLPEAHAELLAASAASGGAAPSSSQKQRRRRSGAAAADGGGSGSDDEEAPGSRGRGDKDAAAGSGGRREPPAWQEDRQPYAGGGGSRSGGAAGEGRGRDASASPLSARGEVAGGSFPGPPRTPQDKRPGEAGRGGWADRGYGDAGDNRGSKPGGSGLGAPVLPANLADLVLREFGEKLSVALRSNPSGTVSQALAYDLLPLPLADRVRPGTQLTLAKLLRDHYPAFELRRERADGPLLVMRNPTPGRAPDRACNYWDPVALGGCKKGDVCDFKHDLVPSGGGGGGGRF